MVQGSCDGRRLKCIIFISNGPTTKKYFFSLILYHTKALKQRPTTKAVGPYCALSKADNKRPIKNEKIRVFLNIQEISCIVCF